MTPSETVVTEMKFDKYVFDENEITLEDLLALSTGRVTPKFAALGKQLSLRILLNSTVQVNTIRSDDPDSRPEFQHLSAVIRKLLPQDWYLPRDLVLFELEDYSKSNRYRYRDNQFKPVNVILRLEGRASPNQWSLTPDVTISSYELAGNDRSSFIPRTSNVTFVGPDDRFTVFQYFHKLDIRREHMTKIYYKKEDEFLRLHCVAIPFKLLALILQDENENEGYRRSSI